jgi:predicted component of type VI protein secretion system
MLWEVRLVLRDEDMVPTQLGKTSRLGRTSYLVRQRVASEKRWQDHVFNPLSRGP